MGFEEHSTNKRFSGEDFITRAGNHLGMGIEIAGSLAHDGLVRPGKNTVAEPLLFWLGAIIKGIFPLLAAIIMGAFSIIGGVVKGIIKIFASIEYLKGSHFLNGLGDIFSTIIGTIIMVGGKLIAWLQSIFPLQNFERPLTVQEQSHLYKIFRSALNHQVIRLIEGRAGFFGLNARPLTLGNTIYLKKARLTTELLVHETVHVWQYQHIGLRYTSDALVAQFFTGDAYNWQKEINGDKKKTWTELNKEAQAEFFQDLWQSGQLRHKDGHLLKWGNGAFFEGNGADKLGHFEFDQKYYTSFALNAVNTVRIA